LVLVFSRIDFSSGFWILLVFSRIVLQQDLGLVLVSGLWIGWSSSGYWTENSLRLLIGFQHRIWISDGFRTIGLISMVLDSDHLWAGLAQVLRIGIGSLTELDLKRLDRNWIWKKLTDQAFNTIS
jgi:hypothetical protein